MAAMKLGNTYEMVLTMLTRHVQSRLKKNGNPGAPVQGLANLIAGLRVSRQYRRDIPEHLRNIVSREYLRGILTDHRAV